MKNKVLVTSGMVVVSFAIGTSIACAISNAETDKFIEEVDVFLDEYEQHKAERAMAPEFSWKEQMIAKITGFEVGNTGDNGEGCPICMYYVASACVNRMNNWYDGDPIAMVCDHNDEYYMMNPDYVLATDVNGWNYYEHSEEMLQVVKEAEERTADCWYWDCDDSQRAWAELVYHCPTDGMWFYR